jgi:hypothetical protein
MKQNRNIKTDDIFKIGINKSIQNGHLSFFEGSKASKCILHVIYTKYKTESAIPMSLNANQTNSRLWDGGRCRNWKRTISPIVLATFENTCIWT